MGKTYAMLGEAHRRLERGTDVVAAVVETHGRNKTAKLLEGIEMIPPRYVEYRGARFPELDVEAVLRRHPQVVLVDELAHTNTPGSKNPKRWQDVQEILDAGITVISTVNIQHLEGLNDVVEQITGIEQKEKIPDEIVRAADQVELVDITPEALRRRLAHGNVYAAERVDAALSNYFRTGNLTALREIALLWLADQVDAALEKYRADKKITATWEARERVVVAVTGGPESETLVRRASRIASKSSAELMVVHVIRGDGLAGVSAPQLGRVRELATSLGATMHTVVGDDVPTALLDFAREMNATQLVVGTSRRSRWARLFDEGSAPAPSRSPAASTFTWSPIPRPAGPPGGRGSPARAAYRVVAGRAGGALGDLRHHGGLARPIHGHRRRERVVLHRRADRGVAGRRRPRRIVGLAVGHAAELLSDRAPLHLDHRRTGRRSNRIRVVGDGRCGGGVGGRRG